MKKLPLILVLLSLSFGLTPKPVCAQEDSEITREAAALGSGSPALQAFMARSASQHVPPDFVLGVLRGAQELRAQGLPTEPYLLKANEGLAKGVPPPKISPALQRSREQTKTAADLVDRAVAGQAHPVSPQARERAILQYQSALLNGVPPQRLESLSEAPLGLTELGSAAHALVPKRTPEWVIPSSALPRIPVPLSSPGLGPIKPLPGRGLLPPGLEKQSEKGWKFPKEAKEPKSYPEKKSSSGWEKKSQWESHDWQEKPSKGEGGGHGHGKGKGD